MSRTSTGAVCTRGTNRRADLSRPSEPSPATGPAHITEITGERTGLLPPAESIDPKGNWILCHAICRWCGRPSWDHFPEGVVAGRYRCAYCGRTQVEPDDERGCVT